MLALIEQETYYNSKDDDNSDNDSEYTNIDDLINLQLKALLTTQLSIQRLKESPNTYLPSTLPLCLY